MKISSNVLLVVATACMLSGAVLFIWFLIASMDNYYLITLSVLLSAISATLSKTVGDREFHERIIRLEHYLIRDRNNL